MTAGLHADIDIRTSHSFRLRASFEIPRGTTVALLGPNGAGKSTVVSALAGLVALDAGEISLDGRPLDSPGRNIFVPPEERRIGIVFQQYLLFPHLSVRDNVTFGLRSRGIARPEASNLAEEWMARLDVAQLAERRPRELSGGEAQRVALARALAGDPEVLLLDEPLAALDVATRAELRHTLADYLGAFEGPRLLITHDPTEAFLLADEIYVLEDGEVTQTGSAEQIRLRPRTRYAADLAGFNLIMGEVHDGVIDTGEQPLHIVDAGLTGPVLATVHPTAISLYPEAPHGSPRNTWQTTVDRVERMGPRIRLRTGTPLALTVEVTEASRLELGLEPGASIWVAVKATEIDVQPASGVVDTD